MQTFSAFLKTELKQRQERNANYSLRAFAKFLDIDPSSLSKIMSNRKSVGPTMMKRLASRLGLSSTELSIFCAEHAMESGFLFEPLNLKTFAAMSDWYHQAILELIQVENFQGTPEWISQQLGITLNEAQQAIRDLISMQLISLKEDGGWIDKSSGATSTIQPGVTSLVAKQLQRQFLQKAQSSLETDSIEIREHTSLTFAIDQNRIPELKKLLKKFRADVAQLVDSAETKDSIYNLTMALFPITQTTHNQIDL
ncbi:MAG: TIGR02147 family protein [Pseudobdellovibrio sp.]